MTVLSRLKRNRTLITALIATLPVLAVFHYANEALKDFYVFEKSNGYPLDLDIDRFHFHLKRVLMKDVIKLRSTDLPEETSLPSYYITIAETDLERLNSDLPRSGREQYVTGFIKKGSDGSPLKAEFRYRGGMANHWLYDQKSFRVKLPRFSTLDGDQAFNLINPPDDSICRDCVSYELAQDFGLQSPKYYPVRLFLNNEYRGVYIYLSQIDESFLRNNKRMPGSLYDGDLQYGDILRGNKVVFDAYSMTDKDGTSMLWKDPMVWGKSGARNRDLSEDRRDLQKFIDIINEPDPIVFYNQFRQYFNQEKFYALMALDNYFGTHHRDFAHNHKLYFDPYLGKFEPIAWDLRFWNNEYRKDASAYPLLTKIALNPILEFERDLYSYRKLLKHSVEEQIQRFEKFKSAVAKDLKADIYRDRVVDHRALETQHAIPLTIDDFEESITQDSQWLKSRNKILFDIYSSTAAQYEVISIDENSFKVRFAVSGNSPIDIDLTEFGDASENTRIHRDMNDNGIVDQDELANVKQDRVYPGRKYNKSLLVSSSEIRKFGDGWLAPDRLTYSYLFINATPNKGDKFATNSITQAPVEVHESESGFAPSDQVASIHPWEVIAQIQDKTSIKLSGLQQITGKKVFDNCTDVEIAPGTRFLLNAKASVVFYCKVTAKGTAKQPILFTRAKDSNMPWGSIIIHGQNANGTTLKYVEVSGGSLLRHNLIDYPGQFNIHDVEGFTITNSTFMNNDIGDDNLHIAYSKGTITSSRFFNSKFDALDVDISNVEIRESSFIDNGNDGIDSMTSKVNISGVLISKSGDKCISVGEESNILITETFADRCLTGLAVKDRSIAKIDSMHFLRPEGAPISLYNKNPRYDRGGSVIIRKASGLIVDQIQEDNRSEVIIENKALITPDTSWGTAIPGISKIPNNVPEFDKILGGIIH